MGEDREKWDSISDGERQDETERDGLTDRERRIEVPQAVFSAVWMAEQVHQSRNF